MNPLLEIKSILPFLKNRIPGQVIIQYTDYCNAKCVQCSMNVTNKYPRTKLDFETTKKIIKSCGDKGVQSLSITGGEPLLFMDEVISLLQYAGDIGIKYTRTGTNGFIFLHSDNKNFESKIEKIAKKMARTNIYSFWVSIDSADIATHEKMRGLPGVIQGIKKALPIFHEHGIYPSANLGINRNIGGEIEELYNVESLSSQRVYEIFKESFQKFYEFVIDLGFKTTNACYPMSIDETQTDLNAVYGASSEDLAIKFTKDEKISIFRALLDTLPLYRDKIRIFTPKISLWMLINQLTNSELKPIPCKGGIDFFFIDAKDGNTYPCGYRGNENLGKFWDLNINRLKDNKHCVACDWECFRDPSEMLGGFLEMFHSPVQFHKKKKQYPEYWNILKEDLRYYKKCNYFNGRKL